MALNHCIETTLGLYLGQVTHTRHTPIAHTFTRPLFFFSLPLTLLEQKPDALPKALGFWRHWLRYREHQYCPGERSQVLSERVRSWVLQKAGLSPAPTAEDLAHIRLIATLNTGLPGLNFGYNPVVFYACSRHDGTPTLLVAEVTNTFYEHKAFALWTIQGVTPGSIPQQQTKHFYVSPFAHVADHFAFNLPWPGDTLRFTIETRHRDTQAPQVTAALSMAWQPLTPQALTPLVLQHPVMPIEMLAAIHLQAFHLWRKGVPFYPKEALTELQTEVLQWHEQGSPNVLCNR